jgi:pimeloyl-ACP methyl ester carboxylesterase
MSTPTPTPAATREREGVLPVNGLRLHYWEWGDPAAPPVLLLHGLPGNAAEWRTIALRLARRFRVLAVDQRGHGESAWAADYAPALMAEDVAAMIGALGTGPLPVVGHSMGGINSYLCAAAHPGLLTRLVIVDIGPGSCTPALDEAVRTGLRFFARAVYADPDEAVREWAAGNPRAREPELRHYIVHNLRRRDDGGWVWRFDAAHLESWLDQLPDHPTQWTALARVTCPVLVIRGAESEVLLPATAARMVEVLPDARLVEIPDGGHDLTVERPEPVAEAVAQFLAAGDR